MKTIQEQDRDNLLKPQPINTDVSGCQHDFRFSHYETGDNQSTYLQKFAIMICKNCGRYIRQQAF